MPSKLTENERRINVRQGLANCQIEGFEPTKEHMADMESYIQGEKTIEQLIEEKLAAFQRPNLKDAA